MIITLSNKEFKFDKVSKRGNFVIFFDDIFCGDETLSKRVEINYDFLVEMLRNSIKSYINCDIKDRSAEDNLREMFSFYKISNNYNLKKDMASKIGFLIINNPHLVKNKEIIEMYKSYSNLKKMYYRSDQLFSFLVILFRQINKNIYEPIDELFEENEFEISDFILDHYF